MVIKLQLSDDVASIHVDEYLSKYTSPGNMTRETVRSGNGVLSTR
jgi:hypothetical protein